ncbi:MAG: phosphoglucosamine mutase [Desulfobacterales bacterium]|nr:phosphoglucosamine mutase [Desulfobacterales bacterium]
MGQLFGTDGIRGRANTYPMTCELAMKTGQAVGLFTRESGNRSVIIGRDTRVSGQMLESALAAGISSTGVDVLLAGVIPTPGVAYLSSVVEGAGAGIVISASHNPFYDNGIKIFKRGGIKLSDDQEEKIEVRILGEDIVPREEVGKISVITDGCGRYTGFLLEKFPFGKPDKKLKLVIDTSNGAAYECAGQVFKADLFDTVFIHNQPDGKNINENCGSQHTGDVSALVLKEKADIGLAFDGDADRLIAVDDKGREITGDRILAICAKYAKARNSLGNNIVVSTIMSNIGLVNALKTLNIDHEITDVGDRRVLERMQETNATIGGEDSGHMIFLKEHTTGDGMLTALKLLEVMIGTGKSLSDLAEVMTVYPQILMNVEVDASRPDFNKVPLIADAIKEVETLLGEQGRVLVRYSGTQPLLRVMVEGPEVDITRECCEKICQAVRESICKL